MSHRGRRRQPGARPLVSFSRHAGIAFCGSCPTQGIPLSFTALPDVFARALSARAYTTPTPVQSAVLAPETRGRDLLVSAQTGSGKTVAYGLAMAESLMDGDVLPAADAPLALIIAPTRELALQVQTELTWLYAGTKARVMSCVGGMDPFRERRELERGAHIVVGTPGRLRDHLERGVLRLDALKVAVLDEADEMLDLGFHDDMEFLLKATPESRRTFLFSATLPKAIVSLARNYQRDALRIELAAASGGHADIEYRAVRIAHAKVGRAVVNLLRFIDPPCALVFCATRIGVQKLGESLAARGFSSVALSGEMNQNERNRALTALREGRARVCVATDVAARGLDVPDLSLVIHADLPNDAEVLQHRSGRTGRAGKKGISILLVPPSRRRSAEEMMHRARVQYTWAEPPSPKEILAQDRDRLLQSPLFGTPGEGEDVALAEALAGRYAPIEIALVLAKLYRGQLPAPEDLDEYVEDPRKSKRDKYAGEKPTREPFAKKRQRESDRSHALTEGSVWFRISVGRERNADPNWLLPEICRQGEVTKKQIGEIRIFDTETRFELDADAAEEFAAKIAARKKGGVNIYPASSGEPEEGSLPEAAAPFADAPRKPKHRKPKPGKAKPPRTYTPPDPDRKKKRKERKKAKRKKGALEV
jgi:ATP-dependent RNA helicase DeaD